MNLLGAQLTLMLGKVPIPATPDLLELLESVEVTERAQGRSGFQLTFRARRGGVLAAMDYPVVVHPQLQAFSRVIVLVTFNGVPEVVMDGVITHRHLDPGGQPNTGKFTVTGEDISLLMDLEERSAEHPGQPEMLIATKLIVSYPLLGLIPEVIPPPAIDLPLPIERTPTQQGTDYQYLVEMGARYGYRFRIKFTAVPFVNRAYWGPPERISVPQSALSTNMGSETNVESLNFSYDTQATTLVTGRVHDRTVNLALPVMTFASTRPPMALLPAWLVDQPNVRTRAFRESGVTVVQAFAKAQATTDASTDQVVKGTGSLDISVYGALLRPSQLVGVRGAGFSHDGNYLVDEVTHVMKPGHIKQRFVLAREGMGALLPVVRP